MCFRKKSRDPQWRRQLTVQVRLGLIMKSRVTRAEVIADFEQKEGFEDRSFIGKGSEGGKRRHFWFYSRPMYSTNLPVIRKTGQNT